MRLPVSLLCACVWLAVGLGACTTVRNGAELAAIFDSGVAAYDAGRYEEAYRIWSSIDDQDLAAMRNVAMMLRKGEGVKKNPKAALDLYQIPAEAGLPTAQADMADMLIKGEAGQPDPKRALPLLQAAAHANHPYAQFELAQMYEAGEVVPKNLDAARRLYDAAAKRGVKEAGDRLAALGGAPAAGTAAVPAVQGGAQ